MKGARRRTPRRRSGAVRRLQTRRLAAPAHARAARTPSARRASNASARSTWPSARRYRARERRCRTHAPLTSRYANPRSGIKEESTTQNVQNAAMGKRFGRAVLPSIANAPKVVWQGRHRRPPRVQRRRPLSLRPVVAAAPVRARVLMQQSAEGAPANAFAKLGDAVATEAVRRLPNVRQANQAGWAIARARAERPPSCT